MLSAMDLEEFVSIDERRCKDVIKTLNEPNRNAELSKFVSFRSKNQKTLEMDRIAQRTGAGVALWASELMTWRPDDGHLHHAFKVHHR
ncbi:hypothetical protein F2Q69_00061526 [Brassica cretica]|uniref:Uncharacterized protein n=1 Tax=Brassica cretica TaxID=69181 RepID=A0A8S9RFG1_BRACR|nr:hypothetical protein F2Q69_00061526 [Brassica cretica]